MTCVIRLERHTQSRTSSSASHRLKTCHVWHRVSQTTFSAPTAWLAMHYGERVGEPRMQRREARRPNRHRHPLRRAPVSEQADHSLVVTLRSESVNEVGLKSLL